MNDSAKGRIRQPDTGMHGTDRDQPFGFNEEEVVEDENRSPHYRRKGGSGDSVCDSGNTSLHCLSDDGLADNELNE